VTTPAGAVAADAQRQATPPRGGGADNIFSKKYGPLPGWGWTLLAAGGALAVFWWRKRKAAETAATAATAVTTQTGWQNAAEALQQEIDRLQGTSSSTGISTLTPPNPPPNTTKTATTGKTTAPTTTTTGTGTPGPVTDIQVDIRSDSVVTISWRPPQFSSHVPTSTTYSIQVKPKDSAAHNIGSRTSYNVGGLTPGKQYTATITPTGGPGASKSWTMPKKKK
jgi:Fibronectin type III domain